MCYENYAILNENLFEKLRCYKSDVCFSKVPPSSPQSSPYKIYSPPSSVKCEPTDSLETEFEESDMSGDEVEKTLREKVTQEVNQHPLCITFPEAQKFQLKFEVIHLLPTFGGLENEDPHIFLKEFHVVCSGMKLHV